jgi:hypothetical protein
MRKVHDDKLLNLYSSPNITRMTTSRKPSLAGHVACMMDLIKTNTLLGTSPGKRPLVRPRHNWEANAKIDLR